VAVGESPDREVLGEGRFLRLVREGRWEWAERTNCRGAAVLVALTDDDRILLIEQPRPAVGGIAVELPAGLIGDLAPTSRESPLESARRELLEETGHDAAHVIPLVTGAPTVGMASERVHFFLATGLRKVTDQLGDDHERITLHAVPVDEADAWIRGRIALGRVVDLKVYAGLWFARNRPSCVEGEA
jgi:ADP-ribose pyrophosphatase